MGTLDVLEIHTKGSCALCLKDREAADDLSSKNGVSNSLINHHPQGFKLMMRYLKVDIEKLALSIVSPSLQQSPEEDLGNPEVEVEVTSLCHNCKGVTGKFWELYEVYEDALLKMADCVQSLHSLVAEGVNCEGRKEAYERRMRLRCKTFMELLGCRVAEGLRTEITKQCSLSLEVASQRVSLLDGLRARDRDREDVVPQVPSPPEEMSPSATPPSPGLSAPTPPPATPPPHTNEKSSTSTLAPPPRIPPQPSPDDRNSVSSKEAEADVGTNSPPPPPPPSVASSSKSVTVPSSPSNGTAPAPTSSEPQHQSSQQQSQSATSNRPRSSLNGTEEPGTSTSSSMQTEVETRTTVVEEEERRAPQVSNNEIPVAVVLKEEERETEDLEIMHEVITTPAAPPAKVSSSSESRRNRHIRRCNESPPEAEAVINTRSTRWRPSSPSSDEGIGLRKRRRSEVKPTSTTTTPESARATRTKHLLDFKCAHCDRKFLYAHKRWMHMLAKHPIQALSNQLPQGTSEKRLQIAVKRVMRPWTVAVNMSARQPYRCPCCPKTCPSLSKMKLHIMDGHIEKVQAKLGELRKKNSRGGGGGGAAAAPGAAPEFISFKRGNIKDDTSSSESDSD